MPGRLHTLLGIHPPLQHFFQLQFQFIQVGTVIAILVGQNLRFAFLQPLHLFGQTADGLLQALLTAFQGLYFQLQLMGALLPRAAFVTRLFQLLLHLLAAGL